MSEQRTGSIAVNGAEIHYEISGSGHTVVLIHAGITDSRMWDAQVAALEGKFSVLRYDLRGFGRSTLPAGAYAHHDDLRVVLDTLDIPRAVLVGASYGGEVALAFALEHPDRVEALVLVNTLAGAGEVSPALRAGWNDMERALDAGNVEEALEIELRMWVDGPHRAPGEVDPDVRERVRVMDGELLRRQLEDVDAQETDPVRPARERLGEIAIPTLVIAGSLDLPDAIASAETLAREIRGAEKALMPGAAHLPSMERPAEFNRIVSDFLRRRSVEW